MHQGTDHHRWRETDPVILREQAYADDALLEVRRRTHQRYTRNPVDFAQWTLERLALRGHERVLDVGCGQGDLLCRMARASRTWGALVGFDFSPGMAARAVQAADGLPARFFVGDAQAMPFREREFDRVIARHMLYHVPDIDQAIAEATRVLRPRGVFMALTNSANSMPEYAEIRARAADRFESIHSPQNIVLRFSLENGPAYFRDHLLQVRVHTLPGTLRFPSAQPVLEYFASHGAVDMRPGSTEEEWQAILGFVRSEVETIIRREGHFDINKITGAIVGVKGD